MPIARCEPIKEEANAVHVHQLRSASPTLTSWRLFGARPGSNKTKRFAEPCLRNNAKLSRFICCSTAPIGRRRQSSRGANTLHLDAPAVAIKTRKCRTFSQADFGEISDLECITTFAHGGRRVRMLSMEIDGGMVVRSRKGTGCRHRDSRTKSCRNWPVWYVVGENCWQRSLTDRTDRGWMLIWRAWKIWQ